MEIYYTQVKQDLANFSLFNKMLQALNYLTDSEYAKFELDFYENADSQVAAELILLGHQRKLYEKELFASADRF